MHDTSLLILSSAPEQRGSLVEAAKRAGFSVVARPPAPGGSKSAASYGIVLYDWSDGLPDECARKVERFLLNPDRDGAVVGLVYPPNSGTCSLLNRLDDIVFPPYDEEEIVTRLKRIADRRTHQNVIESQDVVVDLDGHEVTVRDERVAFTFTEFRVLSQLLTRRGRVVTKDELCRAVWGDNAGLNREALDVHVRRMRGKLKSAGVSPVETVRKVGYRYVG